MVDVLWTHLVMICMLSFLAPRVGSRSSVISTQHGASAAWQRQPTEHPRDVTRIVETRWPWLCRLSHQWKPRRHGIALSMWIGKKGKGSPYSITERKVPELIPVLGSQHAGDVSHSRLPLLSARPAVTPATLKRAATNFAASWTEAQWVWTVCLRLLPDSIATAIWTRALLRMSPARQPLGYRATWICG